MSSIPQNNPPPHGKRAVFHNQTTYSVLLEFPGEGLKHFVEPRESKTISPSVGLIHVYTNTCRYVGCIEKKESCVSELRSGKGAKNTRLFVEWSGASS